MRKNIIRPCPICGNHQLKLNIEHVTLYCKQEFKYLKCNRCNSVYVDPVPNDEILSKIYNKETYHDSHYLPDCQNLYIDSIQYLFDYIESKSTILDYGCGHGHFIKEAQDQGLIATGVEYGSDIATAAKEYSGCKVFSLQEWENSELVKYDVVHLGDVLEHLTDPHDTLEMLLKHINNNGILFIEGPLERNISVVFIASTIFRHVKKFFRVNNKYVKIPPAHLFIVGEKQQLMFFNKYSNNISLLKWSIYEDGWPYKQGGVVKRIIAYVAIFFSGKKFFGATFGNRFYAVFKVNNN